MTARADRGVFGTLIILEKRRTRRSNTMKTNLLQSLAVMTEGCVGKREHRQPKTGTFS